MQEVLQELLNCCSPNGILLQRPVSLQALRSIAAPCCMLQLVLSFIVVVTWVLRY